ncbi:dihydrofolate reductase family protein [Roseivirga echinicomitans]|uniref:Dihydrofolate reductase n=1 Tax=Roseivirga echinicomitans TaxID=296218 RepID=A0A150X9M9_9BACT|nr:dihydrofolate reductase family protein [Roseivirga echinicomitans]KYG75380.1 dihydrofolate reductase [Roseivirga echinicomitans]
MRKLSSFTFLSLNGYYKDLNEDTSWHQHGEEEAKFSESSLQSENTLLFGRTTYQMMSSFWPSPMAAEMFPKVAQGMNKAKKIVFSSTLNEVEWKNTSIMSGNITEQIAKLKLTPGNDMTILGSGSIVAQFSDADLIDTYQIMIDPVALPNGHTLFSGLKDTLNLKLINSKVFNSGVVLLTYEKP